MVINQFSHHFVTSLIKKIYEDSFRTYDEFLEILGNNEGRQVHSKHQVGISMLFERTDMVLETEMHRTKTTIEAILIEVLTLVNSDFEITIKIQPFSGCIQCNSEEPILIVLTLLELIVSKLHHLLKTKRNIKFQIFPPTISGLLFMEID